MHPPDLPVLIVILVCALVLFGPKSLRQIAEDTARALQQFSQQTSHVRPMDRLSLATLVPLGICIVLILTLISLTARQH